MPTNVGSSDRTAIHPGDPKNNKIQALIQNHLKGNPSTHGPPQKKADPELDGINTSLLLHPKNALPNKKVSCKKEYISFSWCTKIQTSQPDRKGPAPKVPRQKTDGHTEPAKKGRRIPIEFLGRRDVGHLFLFALWKAKNDNIPKSKIRLHLASNEKWNPNNQVTKFSHQNPIPFFFVVTCLLFCCLIFVTPRMAPAPLWGAATPGPGKTWNLDDSLARKKPPAHTTLPTLPRSWKDGTFNTSHNGNKNHKERSDLLVPFLVNRS